LIAPRDGLRRFSTSRAAAEAIGRDGAHFHAERPIRARLDLHRDELHGVMRDLQKTCAHRNGKYICGRGLVQRAR